jgi:NADPH2:quinone reductase
VIGKPEVTIENGAAISGLMEQGFVRPVVGARFPLEEAGAALRLLDDRQATGKVVLEFDGGGA